MRGTVNLLAAGRPAWTRTGTTAPHGKKRQAEYQAEHDAAFQQVGELCTMGPVNYDRKISMTVLTVWL
jgi:hypothetical protein